MKIKILFLVFFISCSSIEDKKKSSGQNYDVGQVNDTQFEEEIKQASSSIKVEENLKSEEAQDSYGPMIASSRENNQPTVSLSRDFHILYFHPEDFRTFSYVGVLKKISKDKSINPVMIGGSCFS
ncbi:hypothetical protein N9N67_12470, partial [Bacteriovoracaceae bacterium]|nr:hypothetical protein [Bacteriovoracaceae bacterium]